MSHETSAQNTGSNDKQPSNCQGCGKFYRPAPEVVGPFCQSCAGQGELFAIGTLRATSTRRWSR